MIELKNVSFTYPNGPKAVDNVSLSIGEGEFVALIGHSGAGKTTLAKLIVGLLKPETGWVKVSGLDTKTTPVSKIAEHVGYVFQNPDLMIFSATIYDEVAFALRNRGYREDEVKKRVVQALKEVDLGHKPLDTPPYMLSFGEKHRLAIASVLATEPDLLILDEPTTGLDYARCLKLMEICERLVRKGRSVLIITHDFGLIAEYAGRVLVMKKGRIIRDGATREVLRDVEFLEKEGFMPLQSTLLARKLGLRALTPRELASAILERNP